MGFNVTTAQGRLKTAPGVVDLASQVSGVLPVPNGGTGLATLASGRLVYGAGTGALVSTGTLVFDGTKLSFPGQLQFPAAQAASADANCLDDYEEGSWTPVLTAATPGDLTAVFDVQVGRYTKKGREVTVDLNIRTSTWTFTTASGDVQITGLPFTSLNVTSSISASVAAFNGVTFVGYTSLALRVAPNGAVLTIAKSGSGVANGLLQMADVPTTSVVQFNGTVVYKAAD